MSLPTCNLKIGYVLKRFPNLSQTFILNEILELERQGLQVEIISLSFPRNEPVHHAFKNLKARITYLSDEEAKTQSSIAKAIAVWAEQYKLEHLHAHFATSAAESAMNAAKLCNISFSFTAHARDIYHQKIDKHALAERMAQAEFVVTVSDYNRQYLNDLLVQFNFKAKVFRLYNGLDLSLFKPLEKSATVTGLIVSVGRLVPKKGIKYLIEACNELKNRNIAFTSVIVGDGEEYAMLRELIDKYNLGGQITFAGALTQNEVLRLLSQAETFVLPCTVGDDGDIDGLPTVILEAMALGVPVISTRLTGIPEMIQNGLNGLLVEQKQTVELADAIQKLLASSDLKRQYRNQSLLKMEQAFDLRKNVSQLIHWFAAASKQSALEY